MRNTVAIMQRELLSLFFSPIGYIVIAGFLLITGVIVLVTDSIAPGKPATLRNVFDFTPYVLTIIIPAISMRTIAEEYRSGTIETLTTAPVSDTQFVIGKYLAVLIFSSLPIAMLCLPLGGVSPLELFAMYLALMVSVISFQIFPS